MPTRLLRALPLILLLATGLAAPAQAQDEQVVDQIAAVVEDEIILRSEVDALMQNYMQQQPNVSSPSQELWMSLLNELINQQVMAVQARRDTTIQVSNSQVEQQLDQRIEQMVQQAGSEAQLEKMYGKSINAIKAEFRSDFRNQILAQRLQQRKLQDVKVTPSEVRQWYEDIPADSLPELPDLVRLSHIVRYPKPSQAARERAREIITSIRDSIVNAGASFEEMAREFSDDAGSASYGGRMEDFRQSELLPEFSAIASNLEEGEVSRVFETAQGFHIMRLNDRRGDVLDFNHILIEIDQDAGGGEQAKQFLSAVRDSILSGEATFEEMARRHSEQQRSAKLGGQVTDPQRGNRDLRLDRLSPSWQQTIRVLDEGEISTPKSVELLNGRQAYHIVKLEEYTPAHQVSLETDYDRIKQLALRDKRSRILQDWIDRLREKVYVDVRVQPENLSLATY